LSFIDRLRGGGPGAGEAGKRFREEAKNRFAIMRINHPWIEVLAGACRRFNEDDMVLHASNFTFSAFLSIFPLVLIVASIFGFIFKYNPDTMQKVIDEINKALPQLGLVVETTVKSLVRWSSLAAVIGVVGLLLSVNRLVFSVRKGFRRIWGMPKPKIFQKYLKGLLGSLVMVLLGIAVFVVAYMSSQAISWISGKLGGFMGGLFFVLGILVTVGLFFLIFAIPYWLIPRPRPGLRAVTWGGLVAGVLAFISTYAINIYINRISKTQAIFGSLGVVVGLLLWLYFIGLMLFLGAEVAKVLQDRQSRSEGEQEILEQTT
jgi:membrane protein